MGALLLAALAVQPAEADERALRRFAALLDAPATRARGVDRLSHADPAALRGLPGLDPELLRAAEANAALRHSYGPPRLFSLEGREEELDEVLLRLERASGLVFHRTTLPRGAKVAVRLEDASVLESLTELGRAASFSILGVEGAQIYLQPGPPPARPRVFHGPVMVELERISRRTRIGFDATTSDFWLRLAVWWEPHVMPLDGALACVVTRAVDDAGRPLLSGGPPPAAPRADAFPKAGHGMAIVEGLRAPAADARTLSLEGHVELRLPARVELATFEKPGAVRRPGVLIELKSLAAAESGGTLAELRLVFDAREAAVEHRPSAGDLIFDTDVPLRGLRPGVTAVRVQDREVEFTVRVPGLRRLEDARRLHVRVPAGVAIKRVPFRFEGVPLR